MGGMGVQRKKRASWDEGESDEGFLGFVSIITGWFFMLFDQILSRE